jgi:hypothetical protein
MIRLIEALALSAGLVMFIAACLAFVFGIFYLSEKYISSTYGVPISAALMVFAALTALFYIMLPTIRD